MILELTLLVTAGLGNLAWDITGRRLSARARRRERRERRPKPRSPPPTNASTPQTQALVPRPFLELTRDTADLLDGIVDDFDLVLLRAEAGEALLSDIVFIGAKRPREQAHALLQQWLGALTQLDDPVRDRLRERGLPDTFVEGLLKRELERAQIPRADIDRHALSNTAIEFDHAVVMLEQFIRGVGRDSSHPYR